MTKPTLLMDGEGRFFIAMTLVPNGDHIVAVEANNA